MRAGTQTLIQALQAIPWAGDMENEEEVQHEASNLGGKAEGNSEEEEEDNARRNMNPLAYAPS
jgi:hypothetical protein